jgi:hypothetical protein
MKVDLDTKKSHRVCSYCDIRYIDVWWNEEIKSCTLQKKDSDNNQIGDIEYFSSFDESYAVAVRLLLGHTVRLIPEYRNGICGLLFELVK